MIKILVREKMMTYNLYRNVSLKIIDTEMEEKK